MFEHNARERERGFLRKMKKLGGIFQTATGIENQIVQVTDSHYIFSTSVEGSKNRISRANFRKCIEFVYNVRTVTREDIRKFSDFTTALIALVRKVFEATSKFVISATGLVRLSLEGLRFFFAGGEKGPGDLKHVKKNGGKFILFSYYYIRKGYAWKEHIKNFEFKVLLDSGAFSVFDAQRKGKNVPDIKIEDYAEFIKEHKDYFIGFFNLDVVGDPVATAQNEIYLRKQGLEPIPVYHVQSDMEELDKLVAQEHAVIGIGGTVGMSEPKRKEYFDEIFCRFPEQNFHFLGGSSKLLTQFDWFSADSKAWLVARMYGKIIDRDGQHAAPHIPLDERFRITVEFLSGLEAIGEV